MLIYVYIARLATVKSVHERKRAPIMTGYAPRRIAANLSRRRGRLSPALGISRPDDGHPADCPPVIGVGASAGGLEAFRKFFTGFPSGCCMAFVLIHHLHPTH